MSQKIINHAISHSTRERKSPPFTSPAFSENSKKQKNRKERVKIANPGNSVKDLLSDAYAVFLYAFKGMVDKILGVESKFSGHFRTQWGRLPQQKSNLDQVHNFWKIEKTLCLCVKFLVKMVFVEIECGQDHSRYELTDSGKQCLEGVVRG